MSLYLLLHICCAPDATVPFRSLKAEAEKWENDGVVGYFYGSNVHPESEYRRRVDALKFLSDREKIPVLLRPYDPEEWFAQTSPLANEPEGGARCAVCFALQLSAAAREAERLGKGSAPRLRLCTTLTISPHKDVSLISRLGGKIAASRGLLWEDRIWRKKDGFLRSVRISAELGLYRQNYCGCIYSANKSKRYSELKQKA
jgi:predicted adenine nucleotide alpha hydrolase (AANH) superfamily ATPase